VGTDKWRAAWDSFVGIKRSGGVLGRLSNEGGKYKKEPPKSSHDNGGNAQGSIDAGNKEAYTKHGVGYGGGPHTTGRQEVRPEDLAPSHPTRKHPGWGKCVKIRRL